MLDDAEHDRDLTRCIGVGTQSDLDVTEELGGIEATDVRFEGVAVEGVAWLDRNLPGDHPGLGLAADRLVVLIGGLAFLVEVGHLHGRNGALGELQRHLTIGADTLRAIDAGEGIALVGKPGLQRLHPLLQVPEVEGASVIRGEGLLDHRLGQILRNRIEGHLGELGERLDLNHQLHPQRTIHRCDAGIGEPSSGLDGIEIALQFIAGDPVARTYGHRLIGRDLKALFLRVPAQTLNQNLGDQHPGLLVGYHRLHHRILGIPDRGGVLCQHRAGQKRNPQHQAEDTRPNIDRGAA